MKCAVFSCFQTPVISATRIELNLLFALFDFFSPIFFHITWILCLSLLHQAFTRDSQVDLQAHPFSEHLQLPGFPPKEMSHVLSKNGKNYTFFVTFQEAPAGMGSVLSVSIVSERAAFFPSRALLWSSFDWKYFACLTTCWWIFLCQVMCQELAEHSKLITCVHTVKEKQTARHRWYEEWDFISVTRDCVVNESTQSAGNW